MELKLNKEVIDSLMIVDKSLINQEEIGELTIPDTLPDASKILDTMVCILLKSKEAEQGRTVLKGVLQTTVIYSADDDNVYKVELPLPYTVIANKKDITQECEISAKVSLKDAEAVITNPRKMIVKVCYSALVNTYSKQKIEICSKIEDNNVFQLSNSRELNYLSHYTEKTFVISDDISIDNSSGDIELLSTDYKITSLEYSFSGNRIIVRGSVESAFIYMLSDSISPQKKEHCFDFSQIIDVSDAESIENVVIDIMLNGCYCDIGANASGVNESNFSIELHAVAQCEIYRRKLTCILEDAYSAAGEVVCQWSNHTICERKYVSQISERICQRFENVSNIREIIDAKIKINDIRAENENLKINCTLVGYGMDAQQFPHNMKYNFTVDIDCGAKGDTSYFAHIENIEIFGSEIIFEGEIIVASEITEEASLNNLEYAELTENSMWMNAPSAVIYFCKSGDTLWSVAKKFMSSIDIIKQLNEISEECELEDGRMLLVPKV